MNRPVSAHWLVSGASGFLGQSVVATALRAGHRVTAVVRAASRDAFQREMNRLHPEHCRRLQLVLQDLRAPAGPELQAALKRCDGVLHLAAAKSGDFATQFAGSVRATEHLLAAMAAAAVPRLVLVSSFSVYDYRKLAAGDLLDESAPLLGPFLSADQGAPPHGEIEEQYSRRDAYALCKRMQEELVTSYASQHPELGLAILRPGVIQRDPGDWNARLGFRVRDWIFRTGARAKVPLVHPDSVARSILDAALASSAGTFELRNLVDPHPPTQRQCTRALARQSTRVRVIALNYSLMRFALLSLRWFENILMKSRLRLPGLLILERFEARCKPLRYATLPESGAANANANGNLNGGLA